MTTVSLNKCEKIICRGDLKLNSNSIRDVSNIYFTNETNYLNTITELNSRINSIEGDLISSNTSVQAIDTSINLINTSIQTIDTSINLINTSVQAIDTSINLINTSVQAIDTSINLINTSIQTIDTSINLINVDISNLDNLKYDKSGGHINGNVDVSGLFNLDNKFVYDGSQIIVKTNIIPDVSNVYTLGSIDKPFMDLFLGPSSLYINGNKVLSADNAAELKFETTTNQNLTIQTSGTGVFKLQSTDDLNINTVGENSDINFNTLGGVKINSGLGIVFATNKGIKYQNKQLVLSGDVLIDGSLNVIGGKTVINTEQLEVKDNIVVLNSNQLSNTPVGFQSGFEVNRGNRPKYNLKFTDLGVSGGVFEIGEDNNLQPVATRKSSNDMTGNGLIYWNATHNRFETLSNVSNNNGDIDIVNNRKLLINGVDVLDAIDNSLNNLYTTIGTDQKLSLSGGTMSGSINMNSNVISNSNGMFFSDGSFIGSSR
jgi:prefoldin subunit 5